MQTAMGTHFAELPAMVAGYGELTGSPVDANAVLALACHQHIIWMRLFMSPEDVTKKHLL